MHFLSLSYITEGSVSQPIGVTSKALASRLEYSVRLLSLLKRGSLNLTKINKRLSSFIDMGC